MNFGIKYDNAVLYCCHVNWGDAVEETLVQNIQNHCKTSKIHSSEDIQPGHKKGKVRKADGPYVGAYVTLISEPSLQGAGEVSNIRMGQ